MYIWLILLYINNLIYSLEFVAGDDKYNTYFTKKRRLSGKTLKVALHVMNDNTKHLWLLWTKMKHEKMHNITKQSILKKLDMLRR